MHRAAIIEEFDDDTDLPLPSRALPNTGEKGALLEEILEKNTSHASPLPQRHWATTGPKIIQDATPYKNWTCIYPIYFDAKKPFGNGQRRIALSKSIWWPLSEDIALAMRQLRLHTLHEPQKCHPQDWENPGRVRVLWKKDGQVLNPTIQTKKQLLESIAAVLISKKPHLAVDSANTNAAEPSSKAATKIKQKRQIRPEPPTPLPSPAERVSAFSPALESGILVETMKAGQNAMNTPGTTAEGTSTAQSVAGKGKRKVIRVRG